MCIEDVTYRKYRGGQEETSWWNYQQLAQGWVSSRSLALPLNQGIQQTCSLLSSGILLSRVWLLTKSPSGMLKALTFSRNNYKFMSYCSLLIYLFLLFSSERFFKKISFPILYIALSLCNATHTVFWVFFEEHYCVILLRYLIYPAPKVVFFRKNKANNIDLPTLISAGKVL